MIGEFEFDDIFNSSDNKVPGVTWFIFIVFLIIMTLILMNLLVRRLMYLFFFFKGEMSLIFSVTLNNQKTYLYRQKS